MKPDTDEEIEQRFQRVFHREMTLRAALFFYTRWPPQMGMPELMMVHPRLRRYDELRSVINEDTLLKGLFALNDIAFLGKNILSKSLLLIRGLFAARKKPPRASGKIDRVGSVVLSCGKMCPSLDLTRSEINDLSNCATAPESSETSFHRAGREVSTASVTETKSMPNALHISSPEISIFRDRAKRFIKSRTAGGRSPKFPYL